MKLDGVTDWNLPNLRGAVAPAHALQEPGWFNLVQVLSDPVPQIPARCQGAPDCGRQEAPALTLQARALLWCAAQLAQFSSAYALCQRFAAYRCATRIAV